MIDYVIIVAYSDITHIHITHTHTHTHKRLQQHTHHELHVCNPSWRSAHALFRVQFVERLKIVEIPRTILNNRHHL